MGKTVALIVAYTGFQPVEYAVTKKILAAEGYSLITASNILGVATATIPAITVSIDATFHVLNPETVDALVLIGGSGCLENLDTPVMHELLQRFHEAEKLIAAICIAPRILAYAEILTGFRATGWDGDHNLAAIFKEYGVNYIRETCVVDGAIITATDPQAAQEFAENIIAFFESSNYESF